jgi:hypothetical protein
LIAAERSLRGHHIRGWLVLGVLLLPGLARGQTVEVPTLSLDGARSVLRAAEQKAQQLTAPSSLAVVMATGAEDRVRSYDSAHAPSQIAAAATEPLDDPLVWCILLMRAAGARFG